MSVPLPLPPMLPPPPPAEAAGAEAPRPMAEGPGSPGPRPLPPNDIEPRAALAGLVLEGLPSDPNRLPDVANSDSREATGLGE